MKTISLAIALLFGSLIQAQNAYYDLENKKELKTLSHMIGSWKGEGWVISSETRQKESFVQEEEIFYRLDSSLIEIHGLGKSDGKIVHDAVAIISNNPEGEFTMNSFVGDGRTGEFDLKKEGENYVWTLEVEQGTIRYTISIQDGVWTEKGDFGSNGAWYPFFEMTLKKVKA